MNTAISADGSAITFDRVGTGLVLILVGGAFQHRAFDPRTTEMARLLAENFSVYHYDRRGRGGSSDAFRFTGGRPTQAVAKEIEDIRALIEHSGEDDVFLYGMSSGGVLALEAVAAGLPVKRLAVYEVPLIVNGNRPPIPDSYRDELADRVEAGHRGDAVELFLTQAVGVPTEVVAQMRQSPMWTGFEEVAHTLPYDGALMTVGGTLAPQWAEITISTLVADGERGEPWIHPAADALAATLRSATRTTLAGQDHGVAPEAIAPVLRDFFLA
jgi:pimeloyl-ACP methyl ester carboxylesterase